MKIYQKNNLEKFVIPFYRQLKFYVIINLILLVILYSISLIISKTISLLILLMILLLISLMILLTISIVISHKKIKAHKGYYTKALPIEKSIRKSLIDTMQLNNVKQVSRIEVPDILVDLSELTKKKRITVIIERLASMDDIERLIPLVSNAFKGKYSNYAVTDYVENENKLDFKFILENVKVDKRLIPKTSKDLITKDLYKIKLQKGLSISIEQFPHILIGAKTGGGKSTFLTYIIATINQSNKFKDDEEKASLYLIDPKREFTVLGSISDPFEILDKLKSIVQEMEEREKEVGYKIKELGQNAKSFGYPPTYIIIDELTALVAGYDSKQKKEFDALLRQLVLKGRANSYFLIISLQNAHSETLSVAIRNNLTVKIFLGKGSTEDYRFFFGDNTETISRDIERFTGYILINSYHTTPQRYFLPNLIKNKLNKIEVIKGE